jgi:hypothetical protein
VQVGVAFYALAMDWRHPFSQGEAAANHIRSLEGFEDANLIGSMDYSMQSVAVHIQKPIYHPEARAFRTFVDWGKNRKEVHRKRVYRDARNLVLREGKPVILMFTNLLAAPIPNEVIQLSGNIVAKQIKSFTGALVADENFHIYWVDEDDDL